MKEAYSGGLVLNIESCDHIASVSVREVETAEFDTTNDKITTRYSGMRGVFDEQFPLPKKSWTSWQYRALQISTDIFQVAIVSTF